MPDQVRTLCVFHTMNMKTGPVWLSVYRTIQSCPPDCPLYSTALDPNGCYAANPGRGGSNSLFQKAQRGTIIGTDYTELTDLLRKARRGRMVRLNVSGDYLLPDGSPDHAYIESTNHASHLDVLSYTHAWDRMKPDWFHPKTRPQASCDTLVDIVNARAAGWATVLVDPDHRYPQGSVLPTGTKAVICPNETRKIQCIDCGLCARSDRPSTIVFNVHGTRKNAAARALIQLEQPQEYATA